MTNEVTIRPAKVEDSEAISVLLGQLGYPADPADIPRRIEALAAYPKAVTLVATTRGSVCGVITAHLIPSIHAAEPVAWITSLVVSSDLRSMGIGSSLVGEVERWARDNGAVRVSVTSGKTRERAHHFYAQLGYEHTGLRFTRQLTES